MFNGAEESEHPRNVVALGEMKQAKEPEGAEPARLSGCRIM